MARRVYKKRNTSIEPLLGHIKECFSLDVMQVRGYENAFDLTPMYVLVYQLVTYYNYVTCSDDSAPVRQMFGS